MQIKMTESSIVIVAHDVNVSIFKPPWLINNDIIKEDEFSGNIIITPPTINIPTEKFAFVVFPNRIQMSIPVLYPEAEDDYKRVLCGIVKKLPHTPYTAVGINYEYLLSPDDLNTFENWHRKLFSSSFANTITHKEQHDARFGCYFSYDLADSRLKIDIKPTKAEVGIERLNDAWEREQDLIRINFNFHHDISNKDNKDEYILKIVEKWKDTHTVAKQIIEALSN